MTSCWVTSWWALRGQSVEERPRAGGDHAGARSPARACATLTASRVVEVEDTRLVHAEQPLHRHDLRAGVTRAQHRRPVGHEREVARLETSQRSGVTTPGLRAGPAERWRETTLPRVTVPKTPSTARPPSARCSTRTAAPREPIATVRLLYAV